MQFEPLPRCEADIRLHKLQHVLQLHQADAMLLCSNVNLFYLTGRIFDGYLFVPGEGDSLAFVRRPEHLSLPVGGQLSIAKPEQIPAALKERGIALPARWLL